jgi:hypothetical protein
MYRTLWVVPSPSDGLLAAQPILVVPQRAACSCGRVRRRTHKLITG